MIELILLGIVVGFLSGFFGIGGGTILVPLLLILGYDTKVAIGISVVQMVFSSVFGSYINNKKGTLDVPMITIIGIGGFVGASFSGNITSYFQNTTLEMIFLGFAALALLRMFIKPKAEISKQKASKILLFIIGLFLGAVSMTIGVGGSFILVPILVGFFHVPLKNAISAGLFFVVFSSVSGFISHARLGHIDMERGVLIGLASLFGVYIGIHFKDKVKTVLQRRLLMVFYFFIVSYLFQRIYF